MGPFVIVHPLTQSEGFLPSLPSTATHTQTLLRDEIHDGTFKEKAGDTMKPFENDYG